MIFLLSNINRGPNFISISLPVPELWQCFLYVGFEQITPSQILIKALDILGKDSS